MIGHRKVSKGMYASCAGHWGEPAVCVFFCFFLFGWTALTGWPMKRRRQSCSGIQTRTNMFSNQQVLRVCVFSSASAHPKASTGGGVGRGLRERNPSVTT
ncbi:unnamed protein product [Ectocarpus sp. 4 AP-2014]